MRDNKGWDFLTAFEDIDEKYIYQAAKPWKENKIVRVKRYIRVAAACIILVAAIGGGLTHQNEVKAAWYKMTSLIGRILGIEKETDEYVKTIQKTIEKNGIAVSLEEVAADAKSLWIAYSLTDEKGENDDHRHQSADPGHRSEAGLFQSELFHQNVHGLLRGEPQYLPEQEPVRPRRKRGVSTASGRI